MYPTLSSKQLFLSLTNFYLEEIYLNLSVTVNILPDNLKQVISNITKC